MRRATITCVTIVALSTASIAPASAQGFGLSALATLTGGARTDFPAAAMGADQDNGGRGGPSAGTVIGTAACGGVGAFLGKKIFGGTLGAVLGGLVAGAFCFAALSKRDNERLKQRSLELMQQKEPSKTEWVAPDSNQKVSIETSAAQPVQKRLEYTYSADVQKPPADTTIVAEDYVVVADRVDLRSMPQDTAASTVVGYVNRYEKVQVIGLTKDGNWALIGNEGVVIGYAQLKQGASDALVTETSFAAAPAADPEPAPEPANHTKRKPAAKKPAAPKSAPKFALTKATPKTASGATMITSKTKTAQVNATTFCKSQVARTGDKSLSRQGCLASNGNFTFS